VWERTLYYILLDEVLVKSCGRGTQSTDLRLTFDEKFGRWWKSFMGLKATFVNF
jgi:hypothetical protein